MRLRTGTRLVAVAVLAAAVAVRPLEGQSLATLAVWADDVWLALLDRDGSYYGRLAVEGTFQRFNPLMDAEYQLDLWIGLSSPSEDARWAPVENGFRAAGASINHPFILNFVEWRQRIGIAGPVDLLPRYLRQHSLTAQRDYATVAVQWREAPWNTWALRGGIGVHFFKASADVELGIARRLQPGEGRGWTVDLRLALLDLFNDVIYQGLGVEPEETAAHFDYLSFPLAGRLALAYQGSGVRFEVQAGSSTWSTVSVTFPATGDLPYTQGEQVGFGGALVEVTVSPQWSAAAYGLAARAATDRVFDTPSAEDFRLREETYGVGGRARVPVSPTVSVELDLAAVWRPETRRLGDGSEVDHEDRELVGQVALVRRPPTGWLWRLGYAATDREAGVLAPELTATNQRQLMEGGYRFASGFELVGGVRWDLDRLASSPFDGGHLRFVATW